MKAALPTLFWLSLTAGAFAVAATQAGSVAPQPRPRLEQTATGITKSASAPTPAASSDLPAHHSIIQLEKYTVKDSPLPAVPRPVPPAPQKFSLLNGGPLYKGKLGSLPFEAGLWASNDLIPGSWHSDAQATRVQMDFLRIKF